MICHCISSLAIRITKLNFFIFDIINSDDFFLANQDYNAAPFTALGSVTKGPANIGTLYDTASPTITITTATLTAGIINIYVAYYAAG